MALSGIEADFVNIIKMKDDREVKTVLAEKYTSEFLKEALDRLSKPLKLGYHQRLLAHVLRIDIAAEKQRFVNLLQEVLQSTETNNTLTSSEELGDNDGYKSL